MASVMIQHFWFDYAKIKEIITPESVWQLQILYYDVSVIPNKVKNYTELK